MLVFIILKFTKEQNYQSFYICAHHLVPGTDQLIKPVSHVLNHAGGLNEIKYTERKNSYRICICNVSPIKFISCNVSC